LAAWGKFVYAIVSTAGSYPVSANAYSSSMGVGYCDIAITQLCGYSCGFSSNDIDFTTAELPATCGEKINFTNKLITCENSLTKWKWKFPGAVPSESSDANPVNIHYPNSGIYLVTLIVSTPCGDDSITKEISISGPILKNETGIKEQKCDGLIIDAGNIGGTYNWSTGEHTQSIIASKSGAYSVTVTKDFFCVRTDTIQVPDQDGGNMLFIPNSFTPNNDGLNDVFLPTGTDISEFNMKIYTRWGQLIFESKSATNGWDGFVEGKRAQNDVYVCRIHYVSLCTDTEERDIISHVLVDK